MICGFSVGGVGGKQFRLAEAGSEYGGVFYATKLLYGEF